MNQIMNMVMRTVMRQLINRGVKKGFDVASQGMASRKKAPPAQRPAGVSAEDEAEMAAKAQQPGVNNPWDKNAQKRMQQQMKISRRVGRF